MSLPDTDTELAAEPLADAAPDRAAGSDDEDRPGDVYFARVVSKVCGPASARHRGNTAVLRRALKRPGGPATDAAAMRAIGAALSPTDSLHAATVKVGVASLFAAHSTAGIGKPWRSVGAVLRDASNGSSSPMRDDRAARELQKLITTTDAMQALRHLNRIFTMCAPHGGDIDWALLPDDVAALTAPAPSQQLRRSGNAERAARSRRDRRERVVARWGRDYAATRAPKRAQRNNPAT